AVYHVVEDEIKSLVNEDVYDEQVGMMEMVLDVDDIAETMRDIREEGTKY
ncbi:MAG: glycine/sarcosine/betaine reductase complex selenoprotein A, partial [Finegoldia sp.]|nr:glycine/sarcosine/betaine reductase complex selenoprotein A [Finegoldia sp.]MDY6066064.1 glycine/sarcosine/betaine reductase complex selenoprotein A [Finegoldia sp.]